MKAVLGKELLWIDEHLAEYISKTKSIFDDLRVELQSLHITLQHIFPSAISTILRHETITFSIRSDFGWVALSKHPEEDDVLQTLKKVKYQTVKVNSKIWLPALANAS